MYRRTMLAGASALALASCQNVPADQTIQRIATDAKLIANALAEIVPNLGEVVGLTPALQAQVIGYINMIGPLADRLSSITSVTDARPIVERLAQYANLALGLLGSFPLPPVIATVVTTARVLLPVIMLAVGLAASSPPEPAVSSARAALAATKKK